MCSSAVSVYLRDTFYNLSKVFHDATFSMKTSGFVSPVGLIHFFKKRLAAAAANFRRCSDSGIVDVFILFLILKDVDIIEGLSFHAVYRELYRVL